MATDFQPYMDFNNMQNNMNDLDTSIHIRLNGLAKKKEEDKKKKSEEFYKKQCPFKPTINQYSKAQTRTGDVYSSLYETKNIQKSKLEQLKDREEKKNEKESPFKPVHRSAKMASNDLYRDALQKQDRNYRKTLDVRNIDEECSFTPYVNPKSLKMVKKANIPVLQRIAPSGEEIQQKYKKIEMSRDLLESSECTFSPQINNVDFRDKDIPAHQRLYASQAVYDRKLDILKKKYLADEKKGIKSTPNLQTREYNIKNKIRGTKETMYAKKKADEEDVVEEKSYNKAKTYNRKHVGDESESPKRSETAKSQKKEENFDIEDIEDEKKKNSNHEEEDQDEEVEDEDDE